MASNRVTHNKEHRIARSAGGVSMAAPLLNQSLANRAASKKLSEVRSDDSNSNRLNGGGANSNSSEEEGHG